MIAFRDALKNSNTFKLIEHDVKTGNLSHAYMIVSPDGFVIRQLFPLIACAVYCENDACLDCPTCNKVLHGNHADVKYFNELDKPIKTEDVEGLIEDTFTRPYESEHKLYFVYSADKMNTASQNKLLKTLEEPQSSVTIFLGVQKESSMLDTVKSRTKTLYLDHFSESVVREELFKLSGDEQAASLAAECCDGMLGRAKEIMEGGVYTFMYERAFELLSNLKKSSDVATYLNDSALSKDNLPVFLDILSIIIRDMLTAKTNAPLIMSKHKAQDITYLSDGYSVRALANILYLVNEERKKINFNVGYQGVAENLLFGILEVKYKCR